MISESFHFFRRLIYGLGYFLILSHLQFITRHGNLLRTPFHLQTYTRPSCRFEKKHKSFSEKVQVCLCLYDSDLPKTCKYKDYVCEKWEKEIK